MKLLRFKRSSMIDWEPVACLLICVDLDGVQSYRKHLFHFHVSPLAARVNILRVTRPTNKFTDRMLGYHDGNDTKTKPVKEKNKIKQDTEYLLQNLSSGNA